MSQTRQYCRAQNVLLEMICFIRCRHCLFPDLCTSHVRWSYAVVVLVVFMIVFFDRRASFRIA